MNLIRKLVSQDKRRYVDEKYDLDLTYITRTIIAMGIPADGLEAVWRNKIDPVVDFLNENHPEHFMIYNISEKTYNYDPFGKNRIREYPFEDHHPPSLKLCFQILEDINNWMKSDPTNVALVHCRAGKGRTGCVISCVLLLMGFTMVATEALNHFANMRSEKSIGVTQPSQKRHVEYISDIIYKGVNPKPVTRKLEKILFKNLPNSKNGIAIKIKIFSTITFPHTLIYTSFASSYAQQGEEWNATIIEKYAHKQVILKDDILFEIYDVTKKKEKKIAKFVFHTFFTEKVLQFNKNQIDIACTKDHSKIPDLFSIFLVFDKKFVSESEDKELESYSQRIREIGQGNYREVNKINPKAEAIIDRVNSYDEYMRETYYSSLLSGKKLDIVSEIDSSAPSELEEINKQKRIRSSTIDISKLRSSVSLNDINSVKPVPPPPPSTSKPPVPNRDKPPVPSKRMVPRKVPGEQDSNGNGLNTNSNGLSSSLKLNKTETIENNNGSNNNNNLSVSSNNLKPPSLPKRVSTDQSQYNNTPPPSVPKRNITPTQPPPEETTTLPTKTPNKIPPPINRNTRIGLMSSSPNIQTKSYSQDDVNYKDENEIKKVSRVSNPKKSFSTMRPSKKTDNVNTNNFTKSFSSFDFPPSKNVKNPPLRPSPNKNQRMSMVNTPTQSNNEIDDLVSVLKDIY